MSYAMTHLIIANDLAEQLQIKYKDLFLLANVAPDAVHSRSDFSMQLKGDAHCLQTEEKWGQVYTEAAMIIWYERLKAFYLERLKLVKSEQETDFLKGYVLHVLVDIFNCQLLYGKNLILYKLDVDALRPEYRSECILQDNYLFQNYCESGQMMNRLRHVMAEGLDEKILQDLMLEQFISASDIAMSVEHFINAFESAPKASLDGLKMISVKVTDTFLEQVKEGVLRLLFHFPEAGSTFTMENVYQDTDREK